MAATFTWSQTNGASGSPTTTDLGTSGNLFNFKSNDSATASDYSSNPITAGNNSMAVNLRAKFTGTFNQIDTVKFWMSTDFSPNTGLTVKFLSTQTYATPSTSDISGTTVPTSEPGSANVTIGGSTSGTITSAGSYTDYIRLQLQTTSSAPAGDTSLATFTLQYNEQ